MQSHYIEVPQEDIFMDQKIRFGLLLGCLAILKLGADYEQLLTVVFSFFQGQKNNLHFFKMYCSACTKKSHKMKVRQNL
jgi:hypothetical protein